MTTIEDLLTEWEEADEQGIKISPEELCRDCPELYWEACWQIQAIQAVELIFATGSNEGSQSAIDSAQLTLYTPAESVRIISEYQIETLHASGGLGHIFIATDSVLNRKVAIKFPKWNQMSPEQLFRFEIEAWVTARLDHPGIVPVYSHRQQTTEQPCYVMRFVEGKTLRETILNLHAEAGDSHSPDFYESLPFRSLLQRLLALCEVVAYAHGQQIIHCDIKPSNVILGPFGETLLLDWGLAKVMEEGETNHTGMNGGFPPKWHKVQAMGTPAFASPEQMLGKTTEMDQRTDIYSLGATLHFLLTGQNPVASATQNQPLDRPRTGPAMTPRSLFPGIPAAIDAICRHATEVDPMSRYSSVPELTHDLELYLAGRQVSVLADPFWLRLRRGVQRNPAPVAAMLATVFMAVATGVMGFAMLVQKNCEITKINEQLESVIIEARMTQRQTLATLRSMVDDVILDGRNDTRIRDDSERSLLNHVLKQYFALATLPGKSCECQSIRAECLMQMGKIHLRLSNDQDAFENLQTAAGQFHELIRQTDQIESRVHLAEALSEMGELFVKLGQFDQAASLTHAGIELLDPSRLNLWEWQKSATVLNNLYRVLAQLQQRQG